MERLWFSTSASTIFTQFPVKLLLTERPQEIQVTLNLGFLFGKIKITIPTSQGYTDNEMLASRKG